jgi:hypothetical protein
MVPMARMSPTEIKVCFAISTETDVSNFFLPGGRSAGLFLGPQAADLP